MRHVKQWTGKLSLRMDASDFEQKLVDVEDLFRNQCTFENLWQYEKSLSHLNKTLNQRVRPQDRGRFIKRVTNLQAKLASNQSFLAESSFGRNVETHKTPPQYSGFSSRQPGQQRSSIKPTQYYNKPASYSSTVTDLDNAGVPKDHAICKNIDDYNRKTNATKKQELNAENNLYGPSFNSTVREDIKQQRFPGTNQNRPTELGMNQIMSCTYQSSNRTDENQIRKADEQQHCNRYEGNLIGYNQSQIFNQFPLATVENECNNRSRHARAGKYTVNTKLPPDHHYNLRYIHGLSQDANQIIGKVGNVRVAQRSGDYQEEGVLQQQQYNTNLTERRGTRNNPYNEFELLLSQDKIKATTATNETEYDNVNETGYRDSEYNQSFDNLSLKDPKRVTQTYDHDANEYQRQRQGGEELQQHKPQIEKQRIKEKGRQQQQQVEGIKKTEIVDVTGQVIDYSIKQHPNNDLDDTLSIDDLSLKDPRTVAQTFGHYHDECQRQRQEIEKFEQHHRQSEPIVEDEQQHLQGVQPYQQQVVQERQPQKENMLQERRRYQLEVEEHMQQQEIKRLEERYRQMQTTIAQEQQRHYERLEELQQSQQQVVEEIQLQETRRYQRGVEKQMQRQEIKKLERCHRVIETKIEKGQQRHYQYLQELQQYQQQVVEAWKLQKEMLAKTKRYQREAQEQMQRQEREKLLQHQRQLEEQKIKEKERQQQQQAEEIQKTEIVDISDQFIDDSIKKHPNKNNLEYFTLIRNKAKSFEYNIQQFKGDDYMEYFILHENLMQLIEIMDRIRCEKDENLFPRKIQIIEYIKQLIENLDARNQS